VVSPRIGVRHKADVIAAAERFPGADADSREHYAEDTVAEAPRIEDRWLVLLVDDDVESRRHARHLLESRDLEVIQASNGIAALELIQRLPDRFRLVFTELDLPGISGAVLSETLRIFRPDLPSLCMSSRAVPGAVDGRRCLAKPLQGPDLLAALENGAIHDGGFAFPDVWVTRARARYAAVGDLVEAALELARAAGLDGEG
jgi:CheY-like chemotaxis protein